MFVKICGLTDRAGLDAAVEAGADAVGFVFAESVRRIEPDDARRLCRDLPASVVRVAVMHHPSQAQLDDVVERFDPDWIQTDAEDLDELVVPDRIVTLPVYREGAAGEGTLPDRIHFEGRVSGSGRTADWDEARRIAAGAQMVLAGGLAADNVAQAIERVRPWGVDVSSGVESERGKKDPRRIREFVARVRAIERKS